MASSQDLALTFALPYVSAVPAGNAIIGCPGQAEMPGRSRYYSHSI